ncbi:hypothetical protein CUMW_278870 [Citrus unshiu]|uniref:Uncharacterized protein n=1 Tax=Citrus unshiu TaxID=55188 RepID=A0A2H5N6M3_CITUN|nr:hypothetical protein CUMW_278870 [Citrus unshiu]
MLGYENMRSKYVDKFEVCEILTAQIVLSLLTTLVSSITVLYTPVNDLLKGNSSLLLFLHVLLFISCGHMALPEHSMLKFLLLPGKDWFLVVFLGFHLALGSEV